MYETSGKINMEIKSLSWDMEDKDEMGIEKSILYLVLYYYTIYLHCPIQ